MVNDSQNDSNVNIMNKANNMIPSELLDTMSANQGSLNAEVQFITDYVDSHNQQTSKLKGILNMFMADQSQQLTESESNRNGVRGRPRADTMEAFDNFEGVTSSDQNQKGKYFPNDAVIEKQAKKIKEEYESFITMKKHATSTQQNHMFKGVQALGLTNFYEQLTSSDN